MRFDVRKARVMLDIVMPIAIVLLFLPPCMPKYISEAMPVIYLMQKGIFLLAGIYFIQYRLFQNKYLLLLLGYALWIILVTYMQGNSISELGSHLNLFSLCVITVYSMERDPQKYSGFVATVLTILLLLNTLLWKDGGMYVNVNGQPSFVLGTKTSLTEYQIADCCFIGFYHCLLPKDKRWKSLFLGLVAFFSVVVWNVRQPISTSMICLALFVGLVIVQRYRVALSDAILKWGFLVIIALNIGIVFFDAQMLFENFITNVLHESTDLSYRTIIWQVVLTQILESPWIGHGLNSHTYFAIGSGVAAINQATHNGLLYFMFVGGFFGTIYLLLVCLFFMYRTGIKSSLGRVFQITMICFSMLWISEQLKVNDFFFLCLLGGVSAIWTYQDYYEESEQNSFERHHDLEV